MDDRPIRSLFQREPGKGEAPGEDLSEAALTPEDQEKVRLAREVFSILVKTYKSFRIYLANNELLLRFQTEMLQKFQDFFKQFDDLELRVRSDTMTLLGQPIYRPQDQSDNLAHQLYRDGLRRITFHSNLPPEEIMAFLDVLKKNADRTVEQDYDMITLFWEKDFKFITYHAVEELLPEGVDPQEVEEMADQKIERISTMNYYSDDEDMAYIEPQFGSETDEKRQDIFDNVAPSEDAVMKTELVRSFLALEPQEIQTILKEIENEKIEDLLIDIADTILEIIYTERSFEDFQMLVESLDQVLVMFLNFFDLERATEVLKRLHFLADGFRKTSTKAAAIIDQIIERHSSEERLQALFTGLGQGTVSSITGLGNYLVNLGGSSVPFLCKTLATTTQNDLRKNLCDVLALMGKKNFETVMQSLDEKTERDVRNKIYILTRVSDERSMPFFRKLVQHPTPAVRQMVVASLAHFYNPVTRDVLIQALNDPDLGVRASVLKSLAQTKDTKILDAILPLVREARFHEKQIQEKRLFFATLATLGGNLLSQSLGSILSRQNLKDKDMDDEIRMCAAEALGQIATPDAMAHLREGVKIKRKLVAKTCEEQLALIAQREQEAAV